MSTYKLTAADRRVLAQLQAKRASKPVYTKAAAARAAANSRASGENADKYQEANPLLRALATSYDVQKNISRGAFKALEGIVDLGAGLVGGVGGLLSADFQNKIKGFIEEDWASKYYDESGIYDLGLPEDFEKYSYTNYSYAGQTVEQVAQGVGQMLPTVVAAIATAGVGAAASGAGTAAGSAATTTGVKAALETAANTAGKWAAKNAGTIALGASATGTGMEEAYQDGASYGEGALYGVVSGATEIATEKLLPGPADSFIGKPLFSVGKEIGDQGVKRIIKQTAANAVNEGFEEMVSEASNPLRKSIYKGRDAFEEYGDEEFWKGVGEAGKVGALTSVAFSATVGNMTKGKGYNGDIQASKDAIDTNKSNLAKLQGEKGKYSAEAKAQADANIEQNYRQIEAVLKKATPEKRAEYIERYELTDRFAEDGTLLAKAEDTSGIDPRYISADSRGQENRIKEALDREGVTAYHGELTDQESENLAEVYRAHTASSEYGFADKHVVIVNEMKGTNAYIDGNIIAIGKDMLTSGEHIKKLIHETTHFTEGSAEWQHVFEFVFGKDAGKVKTNLAKEISAVLDGGYGVTSADVDAVVEHIRSGYKTALTKNQRTFISEVVANRMENLLGDSATIERICREKPSLAKRIWERIKALINSVGKSETEREEIKKLRETERLFRAALETGGQDYIRGEIESETVVHYSKDENSSIKQQLREHLDEVIAMDPVADIKYEVTTKQQAIKDAAKAFKRFGDQIDRQGYGIISLTEKELNESIKYEYTASEWAAWQVVPYVLKRGKDISGHGNHKDRSYATRTIAAPVVINDKKGVVGVVIRLTRGSKYKNHRILMPNGSEYVFENQKDAEPTFAGVKGENHRQGPAISSASDTIISQNPEKSTHEVKKSKKISDAEYLSAVESGDMETAQRMVDEAARAAGYTDKLYHGTRQFGFTEFDPAFSDDKISIFVAGSDELAQTYSGRYGTRKVSEAYKVEELSIDEIVTRLNEEATESYEDSELKTEYSIMHQADIKELHGEVDSGIELLQELVESKIKEYAEKMALDFNDSDAKIHKRLFEFKEDLEYYRYDQLSTPLYMLIHHTDAFKGESGIEELEYKIRLRNKLSNCDTREGVVIKKDLDGYGLSILYFDEARELLKRRHSEGNYALYGNPRNQLIIDGRGQNWNDIRHWTGAVHLTKDGTTVERRGEYFRLFDNKTGNEIFHGRLAVNMYSESLSLAERHNFMLEKANNALDVRAEYMHTTRDIARFAKDNGYESVKFENILDNGGNGKSVGAGDVYAYFEPNNLKSADPVTYDDEGKVIPLSQRFDSTKRDIRRSGKVGEPVTSINEEKMQDSEDDKTRAFSESTVWGAIGEAFDHQDAGDDNLILVSKMPRYITEKFGIEGDMYIYRDHAYENMVSEEDAIAAGRKTTRGRRKIHFHNLGMQKMADALLSIEHPIMTIDDTLKEGNPQVVMILPELGNNDAPLYAALSFYTDSKINGRFERLPHIVLTVAERDYFGTEDRPGWSELISKAIEENRVLDYNKNEGHTLTVIAQHTRLGDITKASLDNSISQFLKKINTFKQKKKIKYSRKADTDGEAEKNADNLTDEEREEYYEAVRTIKSYQHRIDLSGIFGELEKRYGRNSARGIAAAWAVKRGEKGVSIDSVISDLEELGFEISGENETDRFEEIRKLYKDAGAEAKRRIEVEEKELRYASLLRTAEDIITVEKGRFFSASIYKGDTLKQIPGLLRSALMNAREVTGGIRKTLLTVKEWYNSPENGMLFKKTDDNELAAADGQIPYDEDVAAFLEEICEGEGALTLTELKKLDKIGSYFLKVAERYQRVFIDGKWLDAEKLAEDKVSVMATAQKNRTFITNGIGNRYMRQFGEPASLCRCVDGYDPDGFFTWWFEAMRNAGVNIEVDSMNTLSAYREWHKAHKKWGDHLENDTVTYRGQKIPIQIAMTLYCSLKTRKSQQGLADSGYEWREGKDNEVRKDKGLIEKTDAINKKSKKNRRRAVEAACKAAENELWSMFSESDRQYILMFESILNEECRKWKIETDKQMKGFSLVSEDGEYYFPTVRAQVNKTVTGANYEGDRVAHLSSNKNVVEGARGSLLLEPIDAVVLRHIRNQLLYKHYAIVAENVSMLLNINVGGNVHNPVTLKTMIEKGGKSSQDLLRMMEKLSKDLQGTPSGEKAEQRFIYEMIEFMRSGYAKYQLGANPKTLFSQLSSLIAACNIIDLSSLARGMKGLVSAETAKDVDKYCAIAELRNTDNVAAKAQGVLDKTGKVGDFLMKGIGFVDRRVVCALFNACQVQVEKDSGLKLGTEENKVEAGKLLTKLILETQQNTFVTERSDAMRGGVLIRSLTMFSADSMKTTARWLDAIGEVSVLKRRIKNTTDEKEIKALEADLKRANGQLVRSSAVIVSQAVYMALLALGFRLLYNKEEEPEEEMKNVGADIFGNMLGGLPLLRDIYSYFSDGYEMENFMISTINDVLIASKKSIDLAASAMKGEAVSKQEVASSIKNIFYSAGQVLGIPVRNVYNFSTGITRRFFPEAGYKVDDYFYKQSYNADLSKAIEKGDEDMVETITGLILDESIGGVKDKGVRSQITKLSQKGYSVLPRSIGDSVTYDGEEIKLTKKQQNRFKDLYSAAGEGAADLVKLQLYRNADEAAQAKAIKFLYDTYYNLALEEAVGVDLESKNVLFAEAIDIEHLAIIYAIASGIEGDKDRKGNVISGSRKAKIEKYVQSLRLTAAEKYLIMGYLGYKCKNGEAQVKAYVNRLKLTRDEKKKLLEYCGYAA